MIKHKFHAKQTIRDGFKFPSMAEARRYDELKLLQRMGDVVFFLRQTPFHLPGNIKYVADFIVFYASGDVVVEDVKGFLTKDFLVKKRLVEQFYPIEIRVIK